MKSISEFLNAGKYAVAGVSRDPKKFGHVVYTTLRKKNMDVVAINPNPLVIDGQEVFKSVSELPDDVKAIIIVTQPEQTIYVAREAINRGIKQIWIQPGAESKNIISELEKEDINLITKSCILMFWKPSGMHSFHRFLKKIFSGLPE
jgi:uncharacterized protein